MLVLWGLGTYRLLGSEWFGWPREATLNLIFVLAGAVFLLALFALIGTLDTLMEMTGSAYAGSSSVLGSVFVARMVLLFFHFNLPYSFCASLSLVSVVVPLTVALRGHKASCHRRKLCREPYSCVCRAHHLVSQASSQSLTGSSSIKLKLARFRYDRRGRRGDQRRLLVQ